MLYFQLLTIPLEYEFARLAMPWMSVLLAFSVTYVNIQRGKLEKQNEALKQQVKELEEELESLRQQNKDTREETP